MATDQGGQRGPKSSRGNPAHGGGGGGGGRDGAGGRFRDRSDERHDRDSNATNNNNIGVPPAVPGFGFQFPGMPGGFQFPAGFMMPGSTPDQPGAPGT